MMYHDDYDQEDQPRQYEFMTIQDIMEELGCGRNKAYELCQTGQIPAFRIGKKWRVKRTELTKWKPK